MEQLSIATDEPRGTLNVAGETIELFLDVRATYSILTRFSGPLSSQTCLITGVDGYSNVRRFTTPINCLVGGLVITHQFSLMPECPIPLLGRDLLQLIRATIHLGTPQANLLPHISGPLFYLREPVQLIHLNISSQVDPRVWATEVPGRAINVTPIKIQLKPNTNYPHKKQKQKQRQQNSIHSRLRHNRVRSQ